MMQRGDLSREGRVGPVGEVGEVRVPIKWRGAGSVVGDVN